MTLHTPSFSLQSESVCFEGDFVFHTVAKAWPKLKALVRRMNTPSIHVDLSQIKRVDSACLALLLALSREAIHKGKSLHFANIPDKMLALAKVSGVAAILF